MGCYPCKSLIPSSILDPMFLVTPGVTSGVVISLLIFWVGGGRSGQGDFDVHAAPYKSWGNIRILSVLTCVRCRILEFGRGWDWGGLGKGVHVFVYPRRLQNQNSGCPCPLPSVVSGSVLEICISL